MAQYFSIDHVIVYVFLGITLIVGLWAGKGVSSMRDYAIGNRQYGTGMLTITLIATGLSGGLIFGLSKHMFIDGTIVFLGEIGVFVSALFAGIFIAPKMSRFHDCITMGDIMEHFYGTDAKMAVGVLGYIYTTLAVIAEIFVISYICEYFFHINGQWGIVIGGGIISLYSSMGGIRSVVLTDLIQFSIIVIAIPVLAHISVAKIGGTQALFTQLPYEKMALFGHAKCYYHIAMFALLSFGTVIASPPFVQRMLMGSDNKTVRDTFVIYGFFNPIFKLALLIISLALFIQYPQTNTDHVMLESIKLLIPAHFQGFFITGLLAVIMSTADSCLNTAGLAITHDVLKPFFEKRGKAINELYWVQWITLLIGIFSMCITLIIPEKEVFFFIFYALALVGTSLAAPFFVGIMGLKTTEKLFWISLVFSTSTFIVLHSILGPNLNCFSTPITMIFSMGILFLYHYWENGSFVFVQQAEKQFDLIEKIWEPTWHNLKSIVLNMLSHFVELKQTTIDKYKNYGAEPLLFAVFMSINYMTPFLLNSGIDVTKLLAIRFLGVFLCIGLLLLSYWPTQWYKNYFPIYWFFTLWYCLPFSTTLLFLLNGSSITWIVNICLSIMLLVVLVDWVTFIWSSLIGALTAWIVYTYCIGTPIVMDIDTIYTLIYTYVFSNLIGLIFARRKQIKHEETTTARRSLIAEKNALRENIAALGTYQSYALAQQKEEITILDARFEALIQEMGRLEGIKAKGPKLKSLQQDLSFRKQQKQDYLSISAYHAMEDHHVTFDAVVLADIFKEVQEIFKRDDIPLPSFTTDITTSHTSIKGEEPLLQALFALCVDFLRQKNAIPQTVLLRIEDCELFYRYRYPDGKNQQPALRITLSLQPHLSPNPDRVYEGSGMLQMDYVPDTETIMGRIEKLTATHYGFVQTKGTDTIQVVLPLNPDHVDPGKKSRENMFLCRIAQADPKVLSTADKKFIQEAMQHGMAPEEVQLALLLIKKYHAHQTRKSGEPYYLHPIAVLRLLWKHVPQADEHMQLAALLHDLAEDTDMCLAFIGACFGKRVMYLVDGLTNMDTGMRGVSRSKPAIYEKMVGKEDVLRIKLCDRLHNMQTIAAKKPAGQLRTARETRKYYLESAKELGLTGLYAELLDWITRTEGKEFV